MRLLATHDDTKRPSPHAPTTIGLRVWSTRQAHATFFSLFRAFFAFTRPFRDRSLFAQTPYMTRPNARSTPPPAAFLPPSAKIRVLKIKKKDDPKAILPMRHDRIELSTNRLKVCCSTNLANVPHSASPLSFSAHRERGAF